MRITAILTSHNRREKTLACLRSYFEQRLRLSADLDAVLVDDGSSDGTTEAVQALGASVTIVRGAGDLYWAAGMALAEEHALSRSTDYLLWLNDDVVLGPSTLQRLLDVAKENRATCIVVGAVCDPDTGELTYSGVQRHRFHPLRFELVEPDAEPVAVSTFNGNVVLVPHAVSSIVGPIDGRFSHGAADFDYGLRATRAGIVSLVMPEVAGTCPRGEHPAPWLDHSISVRKRVILLFGRKGLPPRSTARYLRRHGGRSWPLFWLSPYARFALSLVHLQPPKKSGRPSIESLSRTRKASETHPQDTFGSATTRGHQDGAQRERTSARKPGS